MIDPQVQEINSGSYRLGVTGTMGSGKSDACRELVKTGESIGLLVHHIELDKARVQMLSDDSGYFPIRQAIANQFGNQIIRPDTSIDRQKLRDILVSDERNMQKFNEVTHQAFVDYINEQIQAKTGLFLVEWALLCKQGFANEVDYNFLRVHCDRYVLVPRLKKSSDLSEEQIIAGIDSQGGSYAEHVRILKAQLEAGKGKRIGQLYTFDTTDNPKSDEYLALLRRIVVSIK